MFPNLHHLDLSYCNIMEVEDFAFEDNQVLDTLILTGNHLVSIPLFYKSADNSLSSLILKHNDIHSGDARNIENLLYFDLEDNELTEDILAAVLPNLPKLKHLKLGSNNLVRIEKCLFASQNKLEALSLWNNNIEFIEPGSMDHITTLRYVNLKLNDDLKEYQSEAWHFCHNLEQDILNVELEYNKQISQDLKATDTNDEFCANNFDSNTLSSSCTNSDGHLTCTGDVANLMCELKTMQFKSITFSYPVDLFPDTGPLHVDDYHEAETDSYFREINGKSNQTQYLAELKLYGTKFDLATLYDYVGLRTKEVTISADTIYMSRPVEAPVTYKLSLKARKVSITEDIPMNMTHDQFFSLMPADQPVESWAKIQEVVTGVGDTAMSINKLGFIEVHKPKLQEPRKSDAKICSPRHFTVEEYWLEHKTSPAAFFDGVQINLLRMAVRTLTSTRSNDALALDMVDHTIMKTSNPNIIEDKNAYLVAQKLIRDKELIGTNNRNVPYYTIDVISDLASIMYERMTLYAANETILLLKLDGALGRMADMNKNFEDARLQREAYFEEELSTLEEIWNSTDTAWHWDFNASRSMEESIQDSIQKNAEEAFEMQQQELKEMIERAKDTVESDQAIVKKWEVEIARYSVEAQMSLELQQQKLGEVNDLKDDIDDEKNKLQHAIDKWIAKQIIKSFFGMVKAVIGMVAGIFTMQPEIAGAAAAEGAAQAGHIGEIIAKTMELITNLIEILMEISNMIQSLMDIFGEDMDLGLNGEDISIEAGTNWRSALENAFKMKNMTNAFSDVDIMAKTAIAGVGTATNNEVDPSNLQAVMYTYNDRGTQLTMETINFADIMMHLADLSNELQVAKFNLELAMEQLNRTEQMLDDLIEQHVAYVYWINKHREEYENKCDEFAEAYDTASTETKEAFKKEIIERFERFKQAFEESNKQYIERMNQLTSALYTKMATVKQHSMVQRSMIMNLYQDYCDGLFYFTFSECYCGTMTREIQDDFTCVPTMSDSFTTILNKLNEIKWNSITTISNLPNTPSVFEEVYMKSLQQLFQLIYV